LEKHNGENNCDIHTNGELRFIKRNLGKCRTVFDIGANMGEWTELALKINQNINFHCFEPSSHIFKKLISNDLPDNVICNNFGLSSAKCEKPLFISEDGSGFTSLYQREGLENGWGIKPSKQKEMVRLDTLENYCREKNITEIDFMKVDVEGHEFEIFKGGKSLFDSAQVKIIQFEYGGCNIDSHVFLKDIFDFFKNMNYSFYKIYPDYIRPVQRYDQRFDNFQYQNWLIIRKDYRVVP
jgi:FkbM family methyltransferase